MLGEVTVFSTLVSAFRYRLNQIIVLYNILKSEKNEVKPSEIVVGSGLREVLELIYASDAVDHVMTGKAICRAVPTHLGINDALNALLYAEALEEPAKFLHHTGMMFLCTSSNNLVSCIKVSRLSFLEFLITSVS